MLYVNVFESFTWENSMTHDKTVWSWRQRHERYVYERETRETACVRAQSTRKRYMYEREAPKNGMRASAKHKKTAGVWARSTGKRYVCEREAQENGMCMSAKHDCVRVYGIVIPCRVSSWYPMTKHNKQVVYIRPPMNIYLIENKFKAKVELIYGCLLPWPSR